MESLTFFFCYFLIFIPKEGDPLSKENRKFPSETEGEGGAFLMCYDIFFILDSPVVRTFRLKKCLTTLRVVMSMTYTFSILKRSSGCLFKKVIRPGGIVSKRYIPYLDGDVCLDLIDREKWLGRHPMVLSWSEPASRSSWASAHGTHKYLLLFYLFICIL